MMQSPGLEERVITIQKTTMRKYVGAFTYTQVISSKLEIFREIAGNTLSKESYFRTQNMEILVKKLIKRWFINT